MKFQERDEIVTVTAKIGHRDLVYDKGEGRLGYVKDVMKNIYRPADSDAPRVLIVEVVCKDTYLEMVVEEEIVKKVEKEVKNRWVPFGDYMAKHHSERRGQF